MLLFVHFHIHLLIRALARLRYLTSFYFFPSSSLSQKLLDYCVSHNVPMTILMITLSSDLTLNLILNGS